MSSDPDDTFFDANEGPEMQSDSQELHPDFYSVYEERPFRCCTTCGESLMDLPETYQITKTYHGPEVIMEYAICGPCQQNMLKELSRESVATLTKFQTERSWEPRNDAERGIYSCEFCRQDRRTALRRKQHFSMAALCYGHAMIDRPLLVCESCMLEMNEKMSEQTRGRWRDFVDTHFPGVPADALPDPHTLPVF